MVNSNFTADVFASTFTRLHARGLRPSVLYPAVALPPLASLSAAPTAASVAALARAGIEGVQPGKHALATRARACLARLRALTRVLRVFSAQARACC